MFVRFKPHVDIDSEFCARVRTARKDTDMARRDAHRLVQSMAVDVVNLCSGSRVPVLRVSWVSNRAVMFVSADDPHQARNRIND